VTLDILLLLIVGVATLALVLQAVFIWRLTKSSHQLVDRINRASSDLEAEARLILAQLHEVSSSLDSLKTVSETMGARVGEVNEMFAARAKDLDGLLVQMVEVGSKQATKIDGVVTDTVEKFEQTTGLIQQDLLRPIVEISSIVKGLRSGIGYLFGKKDTDSADARGYPEEDLFI
jgi:hypothetical protein